MNTEATQTIARREAPATQAVRRELLENDHVLVIETEYPVGSSVAMHAHWFSYAAYVIDGGTLQTTDPDGTVHTLELIRGETLWSDAERHGARNIGPTPVRILEVEVKNGHPAVSGERTARVLRPDELQWAPDTFDPSRSIAHLVGNPARPGPYTVRFLARPGYAIALHRHPHEDEYLTVLSGVLHWSDGEAAVGAPEHDLPAGGFLMFPAGSWHRLWVTEETMVQMSGIGPRTYVYAQQQANGFDR